MEPLDTLVCARWVLPVEPEGKVLEDHAVAIRAGRIVAVLPRHEARARWPEVDVVDRPHHALLPGFVNAYTRSATVLLRGRSTPGPIERRWVDAEYVRDGTELALAAMLRGGVTCFADNHLFPEVVAHTAAEAHVRTSVGLVVLDETTRWAAGADDYFEKGLALRDEYRGDPLVTTHFAPLSPVTTSDASLARMRRLADELEIPACIRLHESTREVEASCERHGQRPLERLSRLDLVSPLLVAVHLARATASDLDLLASSGAAAVHCPISNLELGNDVAPVVDLLARGCRVALGTDDATASASLDLMSEMRTAALVASGVSAQPGALVARDVIRMATLEGARALGLGDAIGSLLPGKWADLCCVDLRMARSWPVHDVAAALVHACSSRQVTDTWVAGRHVYADGALPYLDEDAALERADAWRQRFDTDTGGSEPA